MHAYVTTIAWQMDHVYGWSILCGSFELIGWSMVQTDDCRMECFLGGSGMAQLF
jgi:hypothetical protein